MTASRNASVMNLWYAAFTAFFAALFGAAMAILLLVRGALPTAISLFDLMLIVLSTFRLTRLFVYDKVMQFFRDWFPREGEAGPRTVMGELLGCVWCTGLWFALSVSFFYFLTPASWFVILVLAVGGAASFLQVLSSMVGWRADHFKKQAGG